MRVLVTRDRDVAAETTAALARLGHEALLAPVIDITPTSAALPSGSYDAILATSRHAFQRDFDLKRWGMRLPVFAVGRRTAEAARAAGFEDVRIGAGDGEDLATLVSLTLPRPARVLYLAGRDRKPNLESSLTGIGIRLAVVETYAAIPIEHWPEAVAEALREGTIDAALHYSRRSAELALRLTERLGIADAFLLLHHACLSADVAEPLLAAKAFAVAVAEKPDEESLLALLSLRSWARSTGHR